MVKTQRLTGTAILCALVVFLQVFATGVNFVTPGTIPIALVLPVIIVGAAMFGIRTAMALGFCFGAVVLGSGIFGFAPTSAMMWATSPLIMTVGTLGRGLAVGFAAALAYSIFEERNVYIGVIAAAIVAPLVNTAIFAVVFFLFLEVLVPDGAGQTLLQYVTTFVVGVNFVIELVFNLVLASAIVRIINVVKARKS